MSFWSWEAKKGKAIFCLKFPEEKYSWAKVGKGAQTKRRKSHIAEVEPCFNFLCARKRFRSFGTLQKKLEICWGKIFTLKWDDTETVTILFHAFFVEISKSLKQLSLSAQTSQEPHIPFLHLVTLHTASKTSKLVILKLQAQNAS